MVSAEDIAVAERIIQNHVLRPYENQYHGESWRDLPEIPDKSEIMPKDGDRENKENEDFFEEWDAYQQDPLYNPNMPENIIKGPWPSKEEYIAAHYQILREDAIASLRSSVKSFKRNPQMDDDKCTHVYTHIHFQGFILADSGPAFRIEFSHERAGKQIRWEQSSRLQQGTMVALSPQSDSFRSICKVAIVAARPYKGGLDQNPPHVDLFWGDLNDAVFDPVEPYVMIESRAGYFEASRHMLVALQKLRTEQFRLSNHLAELDPDIGIPDWLEEQRFLNLSSLVRQEIDPTTLEPIPIPAEEEVGLYNADVLQGFPNIPSSGMDESQMAACERMVTKKVSIVQGPPGTGKTFTSVSALRIMIENMTSDSPPIIIAAQTNHALDQLLNHVLAFEPNILRLGGRSDKENVEIQKRTLHALRTSNTNLPNGYKGMKAAKALIDKRVQEIRMAVAPVLMDDSLRDETLLREGIITEAQRKSLEEEGWANGEQSVSSTTTLSSPLGQWVGADNLVPLPRAPLVNLGLPVEESDVEYEQLQQVEMEGEDSSEDNDAESLRGTLLLLSPKLTGRCPPGVDDRKIKKLLSSNKNLYDIPIGMRGPIYRYFEKKLNKSLLAKLKDQLREYKAVVDGFRIVKWSNNFKLIRHLGIRVIGCTTTGLSKYRGLLAALQPRTLLIEEAAETLEGTVMAGMLESLEQLILVGDHQQLQAHATIRALEAKPYNLSVSMFERLVNNSIGYTMLNKQRRMITDVRKLLCIEPSPFYSNLHDHPSVLDRKTNRPPIPGMGGKDTYFFHHNWPEQRNSDASRSNIDEAEMVAGFYNHLVMNGTEYSKITVLTFYNGQRKAILKQLKRHSSIGGNTYFNVFTVDSYQGEENDVILLSLVRSNDFLSIGFLENKNRLVVALSRARRGLYIFGNATTLTTEETPGDGGERVVRDPMWQSLICYMRDTARFDLEGGLPITCSKHGKTIRLYEAAQWFGLAGGCNEKCPGMLCCGHRCPYPCHPFDHSRVICAVACTKTLKCGHGCSGHCSEECYCSAPECAISNFEDMNLGNDQVTYDMPIIGETVWDSPAMAGKQRRNAISQPPGGRSSVSPKKGKFASQDIRKNMRRDFSGPNSKRSLSTGNGFMKSGVWGGQHNVFSLARVTPSNHTFVSRWNDWDAKKADKEANDERARIAVESSQVDPATLFFKDTWHAVKIEDGVRVKDPSSSTKSLVPRAETSSLGPKPTHSPPKMPFVSAVAAAKNLQKAVSENDLFDLPNGLPKPLSTGPLNQIPEGYLKQTPTSQSKHQDSLKPIGSSKPTDSFKLVDPSQPTGAAKVITPSKTASSCKTLVHSKTVTSGLSKLSINPPESLLDFDEDVVAQDGLSSNLSDLLVLEVGAPVTDSFGTADDFDEFEKLYM